MKKRRSGKPWNLPNCACSIKLSELSLVKSEVLPKSVKLSRESWRAGFRQAVTNMKFNLGWDHVLVSQQLQLSYSTSLRQLEGEVLRIRTQPVEMLVHRNIRLRLKR